MIYRRGTRLRVENTLMIAPLLDIMFLVLLFFIINTSTGNVESFDVDIPQAKTAENRKPSSQIVVIIKSNEDGYLLNDQMVRDEDFPEALTKVMRDLQTYQILLLASAEADYGKVMKSMDMMKAIGATGVSLGVEKIE